LILLEANYLQTRGRYDEALARYMKAQEHEDAAPYAEYGLGLTFYLMDEGKAALKSFDNSQKKLEAMPDGHNELRFRNSYNSGIIFFQDGDYQSAAAAFKDALRADGRKIEAKRNLELSLMSAERQAKQDTSNENRQENETRELLFNLIQEEEQRLWKSREWAPEEKPTGLDY
jgi:Ca-activated chloride channel family protein